MPFVNGSLLAKSPRGKTPLTLFQHLQDTEQAASEIFRAGTRWSQSYLRFFRLAAGEHARFLLNLRVAALFHDIGKANEDFQSAMLASGFKAQSLRHEHLSALLLCEPAMRAWLDGAPGVDVDVVTAAVLSHHLKAGEDGDWMVLNPKHAPPTRLFFDDQQVCAALARIADVAAIPTFQGIVPAERYEDAAWKTAFDALFRNAHLFGRATRKDPERLKLSLAVKAGLIVSDSVSSGIVREGLSIKTWIDDVAHAPALGPDEIRQSVLDPRIAEIKKSRSFDWHSFQEGAATVGRRGLLLAACGAGKTLAAWRWAEAISKTEQIARVIFLYPTRGTATEGFRDYVAHAPEGEAALVHGTSAYELSQMMANPPESLRGKQIDESEARLYALGLWNKRFFSATVDQFLGFMEHGYKGMCLLPALADAAVVFDEIHSYDRELWNALITFLDRFDVPALCMTATLPPQRRQEIERRRLRTYPTTEDMAQLEDLAEKEAHPRYRLAPTTRDDAITAALSAVTDGQRVLWVVNTVRRCQQLARLLKSRLPNDIEVGVYHSRFRLKDRQDRHRQTIDAFRAPGQGDCRRAIAVTTQVCEMSLDLDADLLVTEHAPISSLVQRFGRANRHIRRGKDFRATLLTYEPESSRPYDSRELKAASTFIAALAGDAISQRDLAIGLEKYALPGERDSRGSTSFTEGGYFATPGNLRDTDDAGCAAVLDCDVDEFTGLSAAKKPTDGLMINVPNKYARAADGLGLPPWMRVADGGHYDAWLGFLVEDAPSPESPGASHE